MRFWSIKSAEMMRWLFRFLPRKRIIAVMNERGRPLRKVTAAVAGTLLGFGGGILLFAAPAKASNFGSIACVSTPTRPRNCVMLADNYQHYWYPEGTLGNQISGFAAAFQQAMDDYENFTNLVTTKQNNSTLDVLVTDFDYGANGLYGWAECLPDSAVSGSHPNMRCDRQKVRFNGNYADGFTYTMMRSLSCHEVGHTVGLRHTTSSNPSSCMDSDGEFSGQSATTSGHEDGHINATYPP